MAHCTEKTKFAVLGRNPMAGLRLLEIAGYEVTPRRQERETFRSKPNRTILAMVRAMGGGFFRDF